MFKMILHATIEEYKSTWVDSDRGEIFSCLQGCKKVLFNLEIVPFLMVLSGTDIQK